jgi:hypothetical protein
MKICRARTDVSSQKGYLSNRGPGVHRMRRDRRVSIRTCAREEPAIGTTSVPTREASGALGAFFILPTIVVCASAQAFEDEPPIQMTLARKSRGGSALENITPW